MFESIRGGTSALLRWPSGPKRTRMSPRPSSTFFVLLHHRPRIRSIYRPSDPSSDHRTSVERDRLSMDSPRTATVVLALLSFAHAQPTLPNLPRQLQITSLADVASDGSGSAPYLHSAPFLLFAIESLLIGVVLVAFGKRAWKATTGLGLGLALELVVWVIIANTLPASGFSPSTTAQGRKDIIIWAIVSASGLVGVVVGSTEWMWAPGMVAMGACGGLSLALSVVMMGSDDLPPVARCVSGFRPGSRSAEHVCNRTDG